MVIRLVLAVGGFIGGWITCAWFMTRAKPVDPCPPPCEEKK